MTFRSSLIGLLISSILLAYIGFFEDPFRKIGKPEKRLFPELIPQNIIAIELQKAGEKLRFQREPHWKITSPITYRADPKKVNSLISAMSDLEFENVLSPIENEDHEDQNDENENDQNVHNDHDEVQNDLYGLKDPFGKIELRSASKTISLVIGNAQAGRLSFVKKSDSEKVFTISNRALSSFQIRADAWRDSRLFPYPVAEIREITIESSIGKATIERGNPNDQNDENDENDSDDLDDQNEDWKMSHPLIGTRLDASFIRFLLQQLSEIRIAEFCEKKALPLQISLRLQMKNGETYEIKIQTPQEKNASLAWAYLPKSGTGIAIPRAFADQIVDPQRAFRSPYLLDQGFGFDEIEIRGEEKFTLSKDLKTGIWWVKGQHHFRADDGLMTRFLRHLSELRITNFITNQVKNEADFGIDFPFKSLTFRRAGKAFLHLRFGFEIQNQIRTHRSDEPSIFAVPFAAVKQIPDKAYQFRDLKLWNIEPENIRSLHLKTDREKELIWRRDEGKWSMQQRRLGEVESAAFDEMIDELCKAKAEDWTHRGGGGEGGFGIGSKGALTIFENQKGEENIDEGNIEIQKIHKIQFGRLTPKGDRYASTQIDGIITIFEFPSDLFEKLNRAMQLVSDR